MCDELVFFAVGTTPTPSPVVTDSPASQFFCSRYYSGAFSCVTDSPASQGQASSPPEPAFALGPVTVPTAPSTPSAPSPEKSVVSPAPTEPQNAPKSGNFLHHMVEHPCLKCFCMLGFLTLHVQKEILINCLSYPGHNPILFAHQE